MATPLQLALLSCLLLGLRHGFDYDHLAAITDITSVQRGWREGMGLGLLYALGHALTVAILGAGVIFLHLSLPHALDALAERLVGATLVTLAAYVLFSLWQSRAQWRDAAPEHRHISRSRLAMIISGLQYVGWRVCWLADPARPQPKPFQFLYNSQSVIGVGIIHGLGAETPSQLLLFLLAAKLGGTSRGLLGLTYFIAGLLLMNTIMTAGASGLFAGSRHRPRLQLTVTSLTAAYSFAVGSIFLFGLSDKLPRLVR